MPHDVTMPQLGMAQDAGRIVAWLKAAGDPVAKGDPLFEVETDKATMEVEAQAAGFLTGIVASEGDDVPVGQVIAQISESAEADSPALAPSAPTTPHESDALPDGKQITMPQLGMAQDSGQMVGWLVELGTKVGPDDLLFEVETDKATMEVPAGASGYLAATLAQAGEDVAVGAPVAILTADAPDSPVARSAADAAPGTPPAPMADVAEPEAAPATAAAAPPAKAPVTAEGGRILASPKARRLALEQGLDLSRLVKSSHPQPYHVADLEVLRSLPDDTAPRTATAQASRRLTARIKRAGLEAFLDWAQSQGVENRDAALAGLLGMGHAETLAIERMGRAECFAIARRLSQVAPSERAPELILRDLRGSFVQDVELGAEDVPVLTLLPKGKGLTLVLECAADHISAPGALDLLNTVAGRLEQPLRHLQ
ncbi:biotin/lipoyl-containing protein [Roseibaca sp. Y0-43]|uniref:biotin/lipoyl-containing protein n=1 Tax=Roseibaca sp. Y0-43 TaxID=2816854 RepID=UPI001D0C1326|nr:biotin/lipoyl-containing protein [Roseibaca sp. Y0-43]MCC1482763.1 pyruvate dehydrogenase [Roseibaca sp. Y0-43]